MRPALALILCISLIGGVIAYANFLNSIRPERVQVLEQAAVDSYALEIVCTFDCRGNDFGQPAVRAQFRDTTLLDRSEFLPAGEAVRVDNIRDIKVGLNDIFVLVTPVESDAADDFALDSSNEPLAETPIQIARAVHVRIYTRGNVVAEKTIWSESAGAISDLVKLDVF